MSCDPEIYPEATMLTETILHLTEGDGYIERINTIELSSKGSDYTRVYGIFDSEDDRASYSGIVHCKTLTTSFRVSYMYFCMCTPATGPRYPDLTVSSL